MRIATISLLAGISLVLLSLPASAQQAPITPQPALDTIQRPIVNEAYTAALLDLNRTKASQRKFAEGEDILKRRLLDKNNRTIGRIDDVAIGPDGKLQTIMADMSGGFSQTMAFNVQSYVVDPTPDTFTIALDKDQIQQNQAQLLAQVETAAGEAPVATLRNLRGSDVRDTSGRLVGQVRDVLIDDISQQTAALLTAVQIGNNRGATIAIPYDPTAIAANGNKITVNVTPEQADTIASLPRRR